MTHEVCKLIKHTLQIAEKLRAQLLPLGSINTLSKGNKYISPLQNHK